MKNIVFKINISLTVLNLRLTY